MEHQQNIPEFVVWAGPMWSGKSSALLAAVDRYRHQGRVVMAFKPQIDDRYSQDNIVTHGGWRVPAMPVTSGLHMVEATLAASEAPSVVAVDELFMIPGGGAALVELFRSGFSVIVSTLDLSAKGLVFDEVAKLLPWATRIDKLTAVCAVCKRDARYTWKKGEGTGMIEVGGAEAYEPRCFSHHPILNEES